MDPLEWVNPRPQKAALGRPHVALHRWKLEGGEGTGTALQSLDAGLGPQDPSGIPVVLRVFVDEHAGLPREGYTLVTTDEDVLITGADPAGAFYGVQSLLGLAAAP